MTRALLLALLLLFGCNESGSIGGGDDDDFAGDDDDATGLELIALGWRLHDEIESMAYVSWEQNVAAAVRVEYSFEDDHWRSTPPNDAEAGEHEQIVLGVPYGTEVQWRVVEDGEGGASADGEPYTTGAYPDGLPMGIITASDPPAWEPTGNFLLSSVCEEIGSWDPGNYWTFIVDRQGRPVWASLAPDRHWTLFAQVSVDGTYILWDDTTWWIDWGQTHGAGTFIHKQYLDAEIEVVPADGLVHAFVELPDGTLAWGSDFHDPGNESIVELAPGAAEPAIIWNCRDHYPGGPNAYCSSNGLFYEASTDTYLYSLWDESIVVEIDGETGENLWWAGGNQGGYDFDPPDSRFNFQHGISYTSEGTLLLHTGGWGAGSTLAAREYEVDHADEVLHEIWNHDHQGGGFGALNGDVWRLPGGNTLHALGSGGIVKEITPGGDEVWVLDFQAERLLGRVEWIDDLYDLASPGAARH